MRALCGVVALVLSFAVAGPVTADHHEKDLKQEVAEFGDRVVAAMMADDIDAMLAMYTEDAISLPNYGPRMQGVDAFRKHHEEMTAAGMKILSFDSEPTEVWGCGDQVIEIGTYEISLEMPGMPETVKDHGKYMTVYVRDADGELKIKAETWNTDQNPMAGMMGQAGEEGEAG